MSVETSAQNVNVFPVSETFTFTKEKDAGSAVSDTTLGLTGSAAAVVARGQIARVVGPVSLAVITPNFSSIAAYLKPVGSAAPGTTGAYYSRIGVSLGCTTGDEPLARITLAFPPGVSEQIKPTPLIDSAPAVEFCMETGATRSDLPVRVVISYNLAIEGCGYVA